MRGYHSLDMRWHRAKLTVVRNRIMIIWCFVLAAYVFSFVLGFIILGRINQAIIRIEENQKGNNCILLIKPADRTEKNIGECIDKNRSDDNKFQFNPPDASSSRTPTETPPTSQSIAVPVKLPEAPKTITPEPPKPQPTPTIDLSPCPILRPILYVIDDGKKLYKCTGDALWQPL